MWIKHVSYDEATGRLRELYDRVKGPGNNVDNIMLAHSLRPHTMEGHLALYKAVLHHPGNTLPRWFREALGIHVSLLNGCIYCVEHHFTGMRRLLGDNQHAQEIRSALEAGIPGEPFSGKEQVALAYARKLTLAPGEVTEGDAAALREAGWDDGEILEINQVVAYFNYANRTAVGLGVDTRGDILGLSPRESEDLREWRHR